MVTEVHRVLAPSARRRRWAVVRAATAAASAPSCAKTCSDTGSPRRLHSQAAGETGAVSYTHLTLPTICSV
eukprot:5919635-Alexandrium_andersonii.AAC.1